MSDATFVIDGSLRYRAAVQYLSANWQAAAKAGRPLVVSIEREHRQRTLAQNKRLHALIGEIAQHPIHGQHFTAEAIKEYVRRRWIGTEEIDLPDGTRIERGLSTTTLSVEECARVIDAVEAWAATELGIEFV